MDTVRHTATSAAAARRPGGLLALALATTTALSVLSPVTTAGSAAMTDVVVTSTSRSVAEVAAAVRAAGGLVRDLLPLAGGVSAELPAGVVLSPTFLVADNAPLTLASRKVADTRRQPTAVRTALGMALPAGEGTGVRIAVIDTGVADSEDFGDRLSHHDVTGTWSEGESRDPYGHGTFVAGVAAGDGTLSDGVYAGVAPGADVLDIRVADDEGETDLATVLKGLEKAADLEADVVNLSLSSGSQLPYQIDPLTVALDRLWAAGTVVVVPTGNDGPSRASVTSPGVDPLLLTVGALDEKLSQDRSDDDVPTFSGRGPAPQGVSKPDLAAPGTSLVSLRATGSRVDVENPSAVVDGHYFRGSGTSFATAAVSGAAAILLQQRADEDLTPGQVKGLVTGTAYAASGLSDARDAGRGGLDLQQALAAAAPQAVDEDLDGPPRGDADAWRAFLQALMDGDRVAAANSWSRLSPEAHKWGAHKWGAHKWGAHKWGAHKWGGDDWAARANSWSAHKWAGGEVSADEWQMRFWAAHKWAAHKWASDSFVAHKWAAHKWASEPAAHKWAAHKWGAHKWAASKWS